MMRRSSLVRILAGLEPLVDPDPAREQVSTPPEAAAELLALAVARDDLVGRIVADLGCGTGTLALGAALCGAREVTGIDADGRALAVARRNAERLHLDFAPASGEVESFGGRADTVVMNPPFGAQRRGADRPFWATADRVARGSIYGFALADSRSFIARWAVGRFRPITETRPIRWALPAIFPHHRRKSARLAVDLWALGPAEPP
ncbi:MAG: METTL5 family protein [Thermoplasmata archaeon]